MRTRILTPKESIILLEYMNEGTQHPNLKVLVHRVRKHLDSLVEEIEFMRGLLNRYDHGDNA